MKEYTKEVFSPMGLFAFYFLLALPVELSLDLQCSCADSPLPTANCAVLQYFYICTNRDKNDTSKLILIPQQDLNSTLQG